MLNAAWHSQHRMPAHATMDQRIKWHLDHAKACGCREIPQTVRKALKERGLRIPSPRAGREG